MLLTSIIDLESVTVHPGLTLRCSADKLTSPPFEKGGEVKCARIPTERMAGVDPTILEWYRLQPSAHAKVEA